MEDFDYKLLHDAALESIRIDWANKKCCLELLAFLCPGQNAVPCVMELSGVQETIIPHEEPWGPSIYINEIQRTGDTWLVEMQSGDEIIIKADTCGLIKQ